MAFPADNFLPAKSVLADTPISGSISFYRSMFEQLDGVRLMLNERRATVGLSQIAAYTEPLQNLAATINTLRSNVESTLSSYLDSVVHSSGSIENLASYTVWTKAAILSAASAGVSGDWTRIPSRNPFGLTASGGALQRGDMLWKEHLNEIFAVVGLLDFPVVSIHLPQNFPGAAEIENRSGSDQSSGTCSEKQALAIAAWNAASWTGPTTGRITRASGVDYSPTPYKVSVSNKRGRATCDLSNVAAGASPHLYLILERAGDFFGQTRPTTADENNYGEWVGAGLVSGINNTTGFVQHSDAVPGFPPPNDVCGAGGVGWFTRSGICIVTGIPWTYPAA